MLQSEVTILAIIHFGLLAFMTPGIPVSSTNKIDRHDITEIYIVESGVKYHCDMFKSYVHKESYIRRLRRSDHMVLCLVFI